MKYQQEIQDAAQAAVRLVAAMGDDEPPVGGSLTVVGTGIRAMGQWTLEAVAAMARAETLVHVIGEPVQEEALRVVNPTAESLTHYYVDGVDRSETYEAMVQHILGAVEGGKRTVAAFYGHPGVFTFPSHEAVRRARRAGYPARMLPAVSAEDCLFADLGIDPGDGCQSYEATDFLMRRQPVDTTSHLVLWQVGAIGVSTWEANGFDLTTFPAFMRRLVGAFGIDHPVTIYEAPFQVGGSARVERMPMGLLRAEMVTLATTLHIPPLHAPLRHAFASPTAAWHAHPAWATAFGA